MTGMPDAVASIPVLQPRSMKNLRTATYSESSVTFDAPPPGVYYYLCQYYDHASEGMYGKLIVRKSRR